MGTVLAGDAVRAGRWRALVRSRVVRVLATGLALGVLAGAAGAGWGARQSTRHEATAVILLNPLQGNPFSPDARGDDLVNLETEAQLVGSDNVLARLGALGGQSLDPAAVSVVVLTNTQLLAVTVVDRDDGRAERSAQSLAMTYLDFRRARTASAVSNQSANLEEQIAERSQERAALVEQLDRLAPDAPGSSLLVQQVLAAVTQIAELRTQLGEVGSASLDPGQVVTPARAAEHGPFTSGPWVPGGLAALVGLVAGCVLAAQVGRRADLVRSPDDLHDLGVPVRGVLEPGPRPALATRLRAIVLAARPTGPTVVLACTVGGGPLAGAGPVLARTFANSRLRTLRIDLDDRDDRDDRDRPPGLSDLLRSGACLDDAVGWDDGPAVLGPGTDDAELDDLASAPAMGALLLDARARAEMVVLCAGPVGSPRTQALSAAADVVVLEVPSGRATYREVEEAVSDLVAAGAVSVAIVIAAPVRRAPRQDRHDPVGAEDGSGRLGPSRAVQHRSVRAVATTAGRRVVRSLERTARTGSGHE